MAFVDDLRKDVATIFSSTWTTRDGQVVPETNDLKLSNDAIKLDAAILYADLASSTGMVSSSPAEKSAEIYKTYLLCAARLIRQQGGIVAAYDGDRVMGVFISDTKRTDAAKCALKISWAVKNVVNVELAKVYKNNTYTVRQAVGVDISNVFVARTGVRGANDLVWVGRSVNYAAKLCTLRQAGYTSFITEAVFDKMNDAAKYSGDPRRLMWEKFTWTEMGVSAYRSSWTWPV